MNIAGLVMGILSIIGMAIGLIPLLGWMNWGVIPFAVIGLLVSIVGVVGARNNKGLGMAGIVLCVIAIVVGAIRLVIGFGVI